MSTMWKKAVRVLSAWAVLGAILACGGGGGGGGGGSSSTTGSYFIRPGFTPDPMIRTGTGGGPFDTTTDGSGCIGMRGAIGQTLHLTADFSYLRVVARANQDISLIIRMSDGTYRCNDDSEGLNPMVEGAFPRGIHTIYVGSMVRDARPNYTMGVSELSSTLPSSLPAPAQ